ELSDVARVKDEGRGLRQGVQSGDGFLKRCCNILVRILVEANVAVADLGKEDASALCLGERRQAVQSKRSRNPARQSPHCGCSRPSHATQKSAAVEAVIALVVDDVIRSARTRIAVLVKPSVVAVVMVTHRSDPPKVERRCAHDLVDRWSLRFILRRREAGCETPRPTSSPVSS